MRRAMHEDTFMENIIKVITYLVAFFGVVILFYEQFIASLILFLIAWIGLIAVWLKNSAVNAILIRNNRSDRWIAGTSQKKGRTDDAN